MDNDGRHALLDQVLARATAIITGSPDTPARPGQVALAHDVLAAMVGDHSGPGQAAGCAPTGVGKGLATGAPAFIMAATRGHRTLFSTQSKALQDQLVGKDFPVIVAAVEELTGTTVTFAAHKGHGNYGCPVRALHTGAELLEHLGAPTDLEPGDIPLSEEAARDLAGRMSDLLDAALVNPGPALMTRVRLDGWERDPEPVLRAAAWVCRESVAAGTADRADFDGDSREAVWGPVSTTPNECSFEACPMFAACPVMAARREAALADVVVVNHTLLALQASLGVPVVVGNKSLAMFNHLVVDEAHDLPPTVRSTGASGISEQRVRSTVRLLTDLIGSSQGFTDTAGDELLRTGEALGSTITSLLTPLAERDSGRPVTFTVDDHPLASMLGPLVGWARSVREYLPSPEGSSDIRLQMRLRRALGAVRGIVDDLATSMEEENPLARWVEVEDRGPGRPPVTVMKFSPVEVGSSISRELFSCPAPESPDETAARKAAESAGKQVDRPRLDLSVTMVSATIPRGFEFDAGLRCTPREYVSPFDDAYATSMLYVPRMSEDELPRVFLPGYGGRWRFDTARHAAWAAEQIVALVRANGGSALVTSSTATAGKHFAQALRSAHLGVPVHSQWDGTDPQRLVGRWRSEASSVLVGTRSMMTGVDAAGDTCTLVVVDRVPRNPGNVVDDARVGILTGKGIDKWAADRSVYCADAALLLEQAAGRLIRSVNDSGLCAVLDPRLMKGVSISYPEPTRQAYMRALRRFTARTGTLSVAADYMRGRRAAA